MPQMSPMPWIIIMFMTMISIYMMMVNIFFIKKSFYYKTNSKMKFQSKIMW
uniref:ATP synthase F0 subunit 8 n=1 Tax=Homotoma ficus TaxID=2218120 RepID=A0A344A2E7_9HEMI|nr:ATP synthase F0 subunit 8 [Homotoma ficus]AWU48938.1 ATP synthase F0 subunit 8 [Homotoma ficus]